MPKSKILFRADSSSDIGIGHVMRNLVLASLFPKSEITFASLDLAGNINHKIKQDGHNLKILKSHSKEDLVKLVNKLECDLLIIDHYEIDKDYESYIKKNTKVSIMCMDDTYKKHSCDILLNHNIYADEKRYKNLVPKECKLLCGSRYTLLRAEFHKEIKKLRHKNSKKTKKIFLSMGGTDHSNINIKILKTLKKFKNIEVNLVTTSANKNLNSLKRYVKNQKWINLHIDSKKIAKLMRQSDFAIVSPSVSVNEVHFMKLPFIAIKTAANQTEMYKYLKRKNHPVLKSFNKKELEIKVSTLLKSFKHA